MTKIINRDVPIAEENETLSGEPSTNMFEDWSERMTDRADNVFHKSEIPENEEERKKRLQEMNQIVEKDISKAKA